MNKKVGVVIPIYNVEKYLRECLDSVINQTYKNLEIVLVNDGSTDENSLNIAKEYTLKDERFILFDKENGGLSSARNVGIEYFSGEYKLQSTNTENDLIEFNVENNHYNIYKAYKSSKAFNNNLENFSHPLIDYIIFLDSDNSWELNCIEECVNKMSNVEVLWFNHSCIYEKGIKDKGQKNRMDIFNYHNECIISPKEYAARAINIGSKDISFSWNGMIDFTFLKGIKLKFIDKIINEDIHFGMVLFASVKKIYVLPKRLYRCCLRANSISNHDKKVSKENITHYFNDIYENFNQDPKEAKKYLKASSRVITALKLIEFFKDKNDENANAIKEAFLSFYAKKALMINKFDKDPLNLKKQLVFIKPLINFTLPYDIDKIWHKIKNTLFKN
ncbi:glycosyltransferase family 2 protein [Campylobacter insulaenigrae]|uniref:glycosyltransferase family 2 protein n=1 Tax=Campylobacter insulaenigrae TaxID=260714 RepID=UPI0021531F0C|nr:glycosyltransferase family 2 protein [Campylobacter insulaenigrae]MCR6573840.1 glycosyltransferase family 2 protein [Campylobacter insulaenigrae]MCR6580100.1 glycosyltransferase family 2 protein [Campylobacter insulaenigrae]MCR6586001.1 glycosyltransferase family 2 protein [Campylobacter insulaenigrae]